MVIQKEKMSQILKFRLTDGHIFNFKYSKYSEFIENLEPEPGVIIEVLEPFTLEDFETAQIEYDKYVVFKEALEDIITTRKLWSKEELKELSKYDLNNPILEWLMIRETREEKEIKEKQIPLRSFEIKYDNIILYCLIGGSNEEKFNKACENGHLEVAQWLYKFYGKTINIHKYDDEAFREACRNGHLKVAQWLYSLGDIDIHFDYKNDSALKNACANGHLEVAQWLYSLGDIDIAEDDFIWTCKWGPLEVAQWLYSIGDIDIHIDDDEAFREACENGQLEVAQWLYSLGDVNIHYENDVAFRLACYKGHLEKAQWLYSLGGIDIHQYDDICFRCACYNGDIEMAQWLWSLGGFYKGGIKTEHQPIKKWLATLE